ncbi:hypothetical protein J2810_004623 [Chryseobacterium rhizosphaerae]|nr:hypothetical protein [Chryseobacterium rhizosphaerae]
MKNNISAYYCQAAFPYVYNCGNTYLHQIAEEILNDNFRRYLYILHKIRRKGFNWLTMQEFRDFHAISYFNRSHIRR